MDAFHPIADFDAVYLVDLCEPLLEVARRRFAKRGWTNVQVLCQDASSFTLPEPDWVEGRDPRGSLSFVTLSYSLSMVRHQVISATLLCARRSCLLIVPTPLFYVIVLP